MTKVVCVGEAMVEFSTEAAGGWQVGFGGDTANTAVHLARSGLHVAYLTALGQDPFSGQLRGRLAQEGVDTSLIVTHPCRNVGLYAISTDPTGERGFTYWREASAARAVFEIEEAHEALSQAARAGLLCFSLISLAILPPDGRLRLLDLARDVRANGGRVAFDGNYRPRLWDSQDAAMRVRDQAIALADIGLPTLDDEAALSGAADAEAVLQHWRDLGCEEVVVKLGAGGCLLPDGKVCPVPTKVQAVDTSGAGDAFNGGYLAARLRGASIREAALAGHALAGWSVTKRGAIPPRDPSAPYTS
jgi:2-dehydro-3-deoxygluconokinase